jgi:ParB-like chromosome segregation protein Spo0J
VVWRGIEALIPYARNARTHSDAQIAQIAGSIREFGFTNPVLIDEAGGIIAGHGRVLGARQLGMDQVPTIALTGLSEAQRRAYVIADNKLALNAGWDPECCGWSWPSLSSPGLIYRLPGLRISS